MEAIATPGHCHGHYCLLLRGNDRSYLFSSDAVFWGGAVIVQNVPDVSVQDYARSVAKLAEYDFDALLPGHHMISMRNGKRHVQTALEGFDRIGERHYQSWDFGPGVTHTRESRSRHRAISRIQC